MTDSIDSRQILRPAQLNALARDLLESGLGQIWLEAEISNFARPASGHMYFTLKDDRAQVRCAFFRQKASSLRFNPKDGQQVLVRGRISLYEPRGDYQLIVEQMEESGEGALRRAFEALKQKLQLEGLFDSARKKTVPMPVKRLGILTSPSGAALQDVISVIARRWPLQQFEVIAIPVQGKEAAPQILSALQGAIDSDRYDALLITRGGGSLEDLWPFNDEMLARKIAQSAIPIISAVGHEVDFTLCDFAADLRAPTPSAAAELLVPDQAAMRKRLQHAADFLHTHIQRSLRERQQTLDRAYMSLSNQHPERRLQLIARELQSKRQRCQLSLERVLSARQIAFSQNKGRLTAQYPGNLLALYKSRMAQLSQRLPQLIEHKLQNSRQQMLNWVRALESLSPLATVARGYSILRDPDGQLIRSIRQAPVQTVLSAQLKDGELDLRVVASRSTDE